jgi:hypothetical protein
LENGARLFEDDDAAVAERERAARLERRTALVISLCDACLCQQAVAIIRVNQGTSGLGERRHDALFCKLGHAQEVDCEAGHIKDLRKAETTLVRHADHNLTNLSTVGCRVVAQLDSRGCDRLEFVEDGQIAEHVPCGTGIEHNCLRVEFDTNMVPGHNAEAARSN